LLAQRRRLPVFDETAFGAIDGGAANADAGFDRFVADAAIGSKQYLRALELAGGMLPLLNRAVSSQRSASMSSTW
jgi:hypothetical protein